MIEVHFHCLPGIDDGPRDWTEAVELCRAAAEDGVETIVATPHVLRDPWINDDPRTIDRLIMELNTRLGGRPRIVPGCEAYFSSDLIDLWERGTGGPLISLNRGAHLLIEFPAGVRPRNAENAVHELSLLGVRPVIAHPERNVEFARDPERLQQLIALGAMTQLTAASVLGEFGAAVEFTACDLLDRGMVHVIASDAHSIDFRPPRLAAARERVRRIWGSEVASALFELNPRAVLSTELETASWRRVHVI